jgi:hypothetical protein
LNSIITCNHFNLTLIKQLGCVLHVLLCFFLQGLAPNYRYKGSWTQWTIITIVIAITITSLKGNWINTHNIAAMTQNSAIIRSSQNSTIIRSIDKGEESRYLLGFERDYVELRRNVNLITLIFLLLNLN